MPVRLRLLPGWRAGPGPYLEPNRPGPLTLFTGRAMLLVDTPGVDRTIDFYRSFSFEASVEGLT